MMADIDEYLSEHADRFEDELCQWLRIPSVSADSKYKKDVHNAGEWLATQFHDLGFSTQLVETEGFPVVYAESEPVPGAPTVLVYGHYDVQPPDPLNEWVSPPFEPTKREGNVYARGATDDKGQLFTHVKSAEAWVRSQGKLPVQLKFVVEGEEEVGSENLGPFLKQHGSQLKSNLVVISDTSQFGPGQPAITYGLRGIAYYELRLKGPKQDLHSGTFGGAVTNPATTAARLLASLVDAEGRIQVPGFYEDVLELDENERRQFAELPFDEAGFEKQLGIAGTSGEKGYTNLERRWARPSYDVCGLDSGYQGEGAKTVIPAKATAKFSFRLVPKQDPQKITQTLRGYLEKQLPPGITMELIDFHGAAGVVVPLDSPYVAAAARAIEHGFGTAPVNIREGGSIPVVSTFHDELGVDTLLLGWGLNDDNTHSPNEKFNLADFHRGIRSSARLWQELAGC